MTTITATAAATQAGVTVATIRTWCRRNVLAAAKIAGRWVIDTTSLAARIAIGAMKRPARKLTAMTNLDLNATYTITEGPRAGTTITPAIRNRVRDGHTTTIIRGLAPLLADRIDAITDTGSRLHTLEVLLGAGITITDETGDFFDNSISIRDEGRLVTSYAGTKDLPVEAVLDLAEKLRDQLAA
ncbi:helix-turn-helix domain-containing protein [Streptomyces sp. NPDC056652]|uniref:helix-turn-helix domain-containing protein n=1 Tax=Streptomyces sp. NPDC056652 TaxID=3345893 RepID=UPI0036BB3533